MSKQSLLLAQAELGDRLTISIRVLCGEVLQQAVAPADHLEQPPTRGVIFFMRLEMLGKMIDPSG